MLVSHFSCLDRDPGGGDSIEFLERGCLFTPTQRELEAPGDCTTTNLLKSQESMIRNSVPNPARGVSTHLTVECLPNEKTLLLRIASIVRMRDPDILTSWDPQSGGLGYLIERAAAIGGKPGKQPGGLDMVRLFGRNPAVEQKPAIPVDGDRDFLALDPKNTSNAAEKTSSEWKGSGLGPDWDERVGPGVAAASIVSIQLP